MKKIFLAALIITVSYTVNAQIKTPQPSPFQKIEQKVGLTDVTLEYSRPGMKNRKIFGDLVPYGELWRTGANKNTIISFSDEVSISGKKLEPGDYAVFVTPNKKSWDITFYADTENWGTPKKWDASKVAAKVTSKVQSIPMKIETFTISFDDLTSNSAMLGMMWENAYVGVKIDVPTSDKVSKSISQVMNGPAAGDFYSSARYYLEEGKDINQAVTWIDKAIDMTKEEPKFWYLRQQALIHAKAGKKKTAIQAAKSSLAGAEKAGNADYVKMNKDFLKQWGGM